MIFGTCRDRLAQVLLRRVSADRRSRAHRAMLPKGLTPKNKRSVAQFDDPEVVRRLLDLPAQLWTEVRRDPKPNFRTLARAQAVLAITSY
jgi:hypothetical protein